MNIFLAQSMVNKAYCWVLARCADQSGMNTFSTIYNTQGITPVVTALATSNEFYSKFVSTYPTGPVDALYIKLLNRLPDSSNFLFLLFFVNV